jgi:hypothetical protein
MAVATELVTTAAELAKTAELDAWLAKSAVSLAAVVAVTAAVEALAAS